MKVSPTQGEAPHTCPPAAVVAAAAAAIHCQNITHYCLTFFQLQQPSMFPGSHGRKKKGIMMNTTKVKNAFHEKISINFQ